MQEEGVLVVIDIDEQIAVGGDGGASLFVVFDIISFEDDVVGSVDVSSIVPGFSELEILVVVEAVGEELLLFAQESNIAVEDGDVGVGVVEPTVGVDGIFIVNEVGGGDEVGDFGSGVVAEGVAVHPILAAAQEDVFVEVGVVGVGVVFPDTAGKRVLAIVDSATGGVVAAVDVEVVEEAVGEEVRLAVHQAHVFGDGGLADCAVVGGPQSIELDGVADDETHGVAEGDDVVVCLVEISAVAEADHVVLSELHVADEPLRAGQRNFIIVAHVRPIKNLAAALPVGRADAQDQEQEDGGESSHGLFQQGGVGLLVNDTVVFEGDGAEYLTGRGVIGLRAVFQVVFVVGGAHRVPVLVVEGDFAAAAVELAFAHRHAALVEVVPFPVEQVVFESALDFEAAVEVIGLVGTVFPPVDVGVFLAFAAVGGVHHLHAFDGVVLIDAVGVEQPVFVIAAEFAVALAVAHFHLQFRGVGAVIEIDGFAVLLLPPVLDDGLRPAVGKIGGFRVRA